jgi:hypothetical protein
VPELRLVADDKDLVAGDSRSPDELVDARVDPRKTNVATVDESLNTLPKLLAVYV